MRNSGIFAMVLLATIFLSGCPGSGRGGGGKPITIDGFYQPTPFDVQSGDGVIPLDIIGDTIVNPPCDTDADCDSGFCHPEWFVCVDCYEDAQCHNGICVANECQDLLVCDIETPCPKDLVCDYELNLCVECADDDHCPEGQECVEHYCQDVAVPCESTEDCPPGLVCNVHNNECVECLDDAHCPELDWCELDAGICLPDMCIPNTKVCIGDGVKSCAPNGSGYGETTICPPGTACEDGECQPLTQCIPGESFCIDETTFRACSPDGTEWMEFPCPADEPFCQDSDGHAQCTGLCEPLCELPPNFCGADAAGCGTLCNACMPGFSCPDWALDVPPGEAVPCEDTCSCAGKVCGDDGCGGYCGECQAGYVCQVGQCVYLGYSCAEGYECILGCDAMPPGNCMDACLAGTSPEAQEPLKALVTCVLEYCGDWLPGCVQEVIDGPCAQYEEKCVSCTPSCFGKECGTDGCGGSCGVCPDGFGCQQGKCIGQGSCKEVLECVMNSQAPPDITLPLCLSQATPDSQATFLKLASCVEDACNNFEPSTPCYQQAIAGPCAKPYTQCTDCVPYCTGKECGADGCGGWCGFCPDGYDCDNGKCACIPDCANKECGSDGCGNICGACPPNFACTPWGKCDCTPDCVNKACGNDGCGGSCGFCAPIQEYCTENGNCIPFNCNPGEMVCDGNTPMICADNGEWIPLGNCPLGSFCQDGSCLPWICEPGTTKCEGNGVSVCADSGAGWLPSVFCPAGTKCQAGQCIPTSGCGDIPNVGCCDGTVFMLCSEEGAIAIQECGPQGCGWIPNWGYGCGGFGEDPSGQFPLACPGSCEPECVSDNGQVKECGPDGCGDVCGLCPPDSVCNNGLCEPFCLPQCQGQECGNDMCGGVCGICAPNETCQDGNCLVPQPCKSMIDCATGCFPLGDQCFDLCAAGADQSSSEYAEFKAVWTCVSKACPAGAPNNCFKSALLGECYQLYLSCVSCSPACVGKMCGPDGCGGACGDCGDSAECVDGECIDVCLPECDGKQCGPNGCDGQCGVCKPGYVCNDGLCEYICQPQCVGKQCGPDSCGNQCGFCLDGYQCTDFGICVPDSICGDGICEADQGETCATCQGDCGKCSNGCESSPFPACGGCKCEKCVCAQDPFCCEVQWDGLCVNECFDCGGCCESNCAGKQCGADGCGGSCGTCPQDYQCKSGKCEVVCIPDCDGIDCGSDGCGGNCGTCQPNQTCKNGTCFSGKPCGELITCAMVCVSQSGAECLFDCLDEGTPEAQDEFFDLVQCVLWQCGMNLDAACMLGAMNGACQQEYQVCQDCTPNCTNKQCGPNGCNGNCGICNDGYFCDNYKCKPICTPSCIGLECGSNGCGGSCGTCGDSEECLNGQCVPLCVPSCAGKQCGDDDCGGLCGTCPPAFVCQDNFCMPVGPQCGDDECNFWEGETCDNCPEDCGKCGDGCSPTDFPGCMGCKCEECVCAMDSFCCEVQWDSICVGECQDCGGCGGCTPECDGMECGKDGCGGSCGFCPPNQTCKGGTCIDQCQPSCLGKQCGADGCGGSCGNCPAGFKCDADFSCVPVCTPNCSGKQCGPDGCNGQCGICGPDEACLNGTCQIAWDCETLLNCLWDCPEDDEVCTSGCWQNASTEAQEQYIMIWECILEVCGPEPVEPCPGQAILQGDCKDEFNACLDCTPACTGKQCGADGCGGDCGECPPGYDCDPFGYCDCVPSCEGQECGSDGCGGDCGACPDGFVCNVFGTCVCLPQCAGKECGTNGCGGSCGSCPVGYSCKAGSCEESCKPQCVTDNGTPKQCGPDGCGGSCGFCPPGLSCTAQGLCSQIGPVCGNQQCETGSNENCLTCPKDCGKCTGDCCTSHNGVGCEDLGVTKCVCAMDPYCCNTQWDGICASEAQNDCGAICGCEPQCAGKQCGEDGCGGTCGTCPAGSICTDEDLCEVVCQPQCNGKQCGPDGCGNTCGSCGDNEQCNAQGQCTCVPNCWNKECGDDSCGGSCGKCGQFQTCTGSGKCAIVTPLCGDGNCMALLQENCDSCPKDCGQCCGNGNCEPAYLENCNSCTQDCGTCCGNNFCEEQFGESCGSCPQDCGPCPAVCGDGECVEDAGESCKSCPEDCGQCPSSCGDGQCDADNENCVSCGTDCGACNGDCCAANGTIGCQEPDIQACVCEMDPYCCNVQWDAICANEAEDDCGADCGVEPGCGDGLCDADLGENCFACSQDCGQCTGDCCEGNNSPGCQDPDITDCVCSKEPACCQDVWYDKCAVLVEDFGCGECGGCIPDCLNKQCGDDGCGGSCGTCPPGLDCNAQGFCEPGPQGDSCPEIFACATACAGDIGCMMACNQTGAPQSQALFSDLMQCILQSCIGNLTTQCMIQAIMFSCNAEYNACMAD